MAKKKKKKIHTFVVTSVVRIEAKTREDAEIELLDKMNEHDICWEWEREDEKQT